MITDQHADSADLGRVFVHRLRVRQSMTRRGARVVCGGTRGCEGRSVTVPDASVDARVPSRTAHRVARRPHAASTAASHHGPRPPPLRRDRRYGLLQVPYIITLPMFLIF